MAAGVTKHGQAMIMAMGPKDVQGGVKLFTPPWDVPTLKP